MIKLEEKQGYKYYNGVSIATEVCLPDNEDISVWNLITNEEAEIIQKGKTENTIKFNIGVNTETNDFIDDILEENLL